MCAERQIVERSDLELTHKNDEVKAFRASIRIYSLFKSERLRANIKLTFHKAVIRSVMAHARPAWGFAADTRLLKLQGCKTKFLAIA
jgi:hypothetical protein